MEAWVTLTFKEKARGAQKMVRRVRKNMKNSTWCHGSWGRKRCSKEEERDQHYPMLPQTPEK